MINLCIKSKVRTSTYYEDTKGDGKCRNLVVWGIVGHSSSLKIAPFDRSYTSSYLLSIVMISPSCIVSEI